jgi:hypothetical protein
MALKYTSREAYILVIHDLYVRAKRSGWTLERAPRNQLAAWLNVSPDALRNHNRAYAITEDDIRAGRV